MKKDSKIAVIDLGSNTFHLLIANVLSGCKFKPIYRKREYVFLSEKGVLCIGQAAYKRGIDCIQAFKKTLDNLGVSHVEVLGTATLRKASNGLQFVKEIKHKTGLTIKIIDGYKEAQLIAKGVVASQPGAMGQSLIMDIGGGSVEFILLQDGIPSWFQSFEIGLSILYRSFHQSEPISHGSQVSLNNFLTKELNPLLTILSDHKIDQFIGASGSFDVIKSIAKHSKLNDHCTKIKISDYQEITNGIIGCTYQERLELNYLPDQRAQHIVVALLLINFVLSKLPTSQIIVSDFAMKEGMLTEMIRKYKF